MTKKEQPVAALFYVILHHRMRIKQFTTFALKVATNNTIRTDD
jgi:hypothetical protein